MDLANLFASMKLPGGALRSLCRAVLRKLPKTVAATVLSAALVLPAAVPAPVQAETGNRSLKLYFIHTKEKAEIVFKRNGRYDKRGLEQLSRFLRDWRRNEPTRMDPRLFDLVWEVYRKVGATGYINVVSAYRSPATNSMLRSRSKGVAKKSQHMLGKAMDFYIPGVKLATLRATAMKFQVGGVGYYPTSGSPFVHLDVGSVRAWPRMSRQELAQLFPDGKTMHIPTDGKPLPGYEQAVADYKRRVGADSVQVAGGGSSPTAEKKRKTNLLAALFGGGGDEDEEPEAIASAAPVEEEAPLRVPAKAVAEEKPVAAETEVAFRAPVPLVRPAFREQKPAEEGVSELALVAPAASGAVAALDAALPKAEEAQPEFADLAAYAVPVPELLGVRRQAGEAEAVQMAAVEDAEELAAVPVPGLRPEVELDQSRAALMAAAEAEVALPVAADRSALAGGEGAVEMAALAAADPFAVEAGAETKSKSARPKKKDADAASRGAIRGEPKLTQKLVSQLALTQDRFATMSKPVTAPRFVSRTMRAAPTTVYLAGFRQEEGAIDPARFSGTAVNFMEVRKFAEAVN